MSTKQTTGLNRNTIDKYYTSENAVNLCLNLIKESITFDKENDIIIEPSAGNGSFITGIKTITDKYVFMDIEPDNIEIQKQDYLTFEHTTLPEHNRVHLIGNPPFGRQSSLAIKFIKKSCEYCDTISFILPKSFKKESLKSRFPLNFHLIKESELPSESFIVDGKAHDVPCIFQIWEKKSTNRVVNEKLEPIGFKFVEKWETPDISFRRVGVYAGKIDTNIADKSMQSHYFIKLENKSDEIIEALKKIEYTSNNTVGPKSISKQELIAKFNPILDV
jgi:predicted RNA methylase